MADIVEFDELNRLEYSRMFADGEAQIRKVWYEHIGMPDLAKALEDTLYDLLMYTYLLGITDTDSDLAIDRVLNGLKLESGFREATDYKVGGKTTHDRILDHVEANSLPRMITLADTEMHRAYSAGAYQEAEAAEKKTGNQVLKVWHTMEDGKVRDTHEYLDKAEVPLRYSFWTYDDDSAKAPGLFSKAENNVNCRCWLTFKYA